LGPHRLTSLGTWQYRTRFHYTVALRSHDQHGKASFARTGSQIGRCLVGQQ